MLLGASIRVWGKTVKAAMSALLSVALVCIAAVGIAFADTSYTVQSGDTLGGIAARYGVTVQAIMSGNGLQASTTIYAGQTLRIPGGSQAAGEQTYTVRSGDNLTVVATRLGVTAQALAAANNISPTAFLYVGQVLRIPAGVAQQPTQAPAPTAAAVPTAAPTSTSPGPQPPATPGETVQYTVKSGDVLSAIAARHSTTVEAILAANKVSDPNTIEVGRVLTIRVGTGTTVKPAAPVEPATPMGKLGPKWIEIDVSTQMLVAYEGTTPIFSARIGSGNATAETVIGSYRVYLKYRSQRMRGGAGAGRYDVANVPDVMYFYSGYAIHGAWGQGNVGTPQGYGGVNLTRDEARRLYEWAPLGTMVMSHR